MVDRGIIASINGVISIGKEAVVIHAHGGDAVLNDPAGNESETEDGNLHCLEIPEECAVKVTSRMAVSHCYSVWIAAWHICYRYL